MSSTPFIVQFAICQVKTRPTRLALVDHHNQSVPVSGCHSLPVNVCVVAHTSNDTVQLLPLLKVSCCSDTWTSADVLHVLAYNA